MEDVVTEINGGSVSWEQERGGGGVAWVVCDGLPLLWGSSDFAFNFSGLFDVQLGAWRKSYVGKWASRQIRTQASRQADVVAVRRADS